MKTIALFLRGVFWIAVSLFSLVGTAFIFYVAHEFLYLAL